MIYIDVKGEVVPSGNEWLYSWYGIQATSPTQVVRALKNANGQPITIKINSGGGDVFAGCEIYNELKNYNGEVTIEIHGLCASIASVIAMAGKCKMSPLAEIMIHNVSTNVSGDYRDMEHTAEVLKKANKTIANAYMLKAGMSEDAAYKLMDKETWFTADEALELGLIDEIMYSDEKVDSNLLNSLKNNAIKFCNSVGKIDRETLSNFKNYNTVINHPRNKSEDDFFIEKYKAKLQLLKLKGGVQ
ncbi:ATP-dependent Clp protease, protease subunit [Clostridium neonatale]|uniref:head maturation protease, ClpP-related n=1 Tax=Clostridium neonatale TaxID=137838 RepID=UPI00291BBB1D|nr:head maturation protease, ClpP-related [Clostridium neonatale]CAI3226940.1 ATP-dependent Clp protease, protease subunit [Clostridium neonatale]